jgi:predicted amidohydrolase
MKVAAYQMPVRACYGTDALVRLRDRVQECEDAGVRLLCCPEGALGGLADYVDAPDDVAVPSDPEALAIQLRPLASRTVAVVVGFTERDEAGRYYNAAAVCVGGSVVGIYRKRHPAIRQSRYSAGTETPIFCVDGMRIGILICRDSTDSRLWATLVQRGAQLVCIPTNNAMPPDRVGRQLAQEVRALDAQQAMHFGVSVIRADVVGAAQGLVSAGVSTNTWPSGASVDASGAEEGELIVARVTADARTRLGPEITAGIKDMGG